MTKPLASVRQTKRATTLRTTRDRLMLELSETRGAMRVLALEMRDDDMSYEQIAQLLGVSHVMIHRWCNPI